MRLARATLGQNNKRERSCVVEHSWTLIRKTNKKSEPKRTTRPEVCGISPSKSSGWSSLPLCSCSTLPEPFLQQCHTQKVSRVYCKGKSTEANSPAILFGLTEERYNAGASLRKSCISGCYSGNLDFSKRKKGRGRVRLKSYMGQLLRIRTGSGFCGEFSVLLCCSGH